MRPTLLLLVLAVHTATAQQPVHSRVKILFDASGHGIRDLGALGIAVDHGAFGPDHFIAELSAMEMDRLRAHGFRYEVLVEDVARAYRARNAAGPPADLRAQGWLCDGARTFPTPAHFHLGAMGGYFTWQELLDELDLMAATYPGLITARSSIGTSIEGRSIDFVRVSNDPNTDQDKPEVLYNAVHHAREPGGISQMVFFLWYLLEHYGTDAEVTHLLDTRELYFVPCVNPDGYVYNETTDPGGGGMWRKNRRDNGDGSFGVDLNRNYGWDWGLDDDGSSPDPFSDVYRGSAPFSEPETQAMRDFCNAHQFRAALNYHTYHNLLIHPWDAVPDLLTVDSALFEEHARLLTRNNGYAHGTTNQVLFYLTNGGSDDWMYGEQVTKGKIMSMTPEVGALDDGFWPPDWRIEDLCEENMDQNLLQAHLAGAYARVIDRSEPVFASTAVAVPFSLQRLGLDTGTYTVSVEPLLNVLSAGPSITFTGMDTLEVRTDTIAVQLMPGLADGDPIRFVLAVDNAGYVVRDTIDRVFGAPAIPLADAGNDLSDWSTVDWGTTTSAYYSPPSSLTDSPSGDYVPFMVNDLTLDDAVDLSQATSATLTFMARWNIIRYLDQLQVRASADNFASSVPLCGLYTHPGSEYQSFHEPVYDGQQYEWVKEEMDLGDFLGSSVKFQFVLSPFSGGTKDGYYVDDVEVTTTTTTGAGVIALDDHDPLLNVYPNPASRSAVVTYHLPFLPVGARLRITDALGGVVREMPLSSPRGRATIDTGTLAQGIYFCAVVAGEPLTGVRRLMVIRP